MNRTRTATAMIIATVTILAFLMLTACGGGGGGGKEQKKERECVLYACLILCWCEEYASGNAANATLASTPIMPGDEYEPNNDPGNASIVDMRTSVQAAESGFELRGRLEGATDTTDFFLFTPPHTGTYRLDLCVESCASYQDDGPAYLMVYDQDQSTLGSTPLGTTSPKDFAVDLVAGLAYYIEINAFEPGETGKHYRVKVSRH